MKKTLTMALVGLFLVLMIAGCMRLNRDTGVVELTPLSFDRQSMADTAAAADAVVPDWLMILGGLGIPSVGSIGLLWKRLKAKNVSLARAEVLEPPQPFGSPVADSVNLHQLGMIGQ